jgi:hypothetical protein
VEVLTEASHFMRQQLAMFLFWGPGPDRGFQLVASRLS